MDELERTMRRVAEAAASELRGAWRQAKQISYKGPIDLVTETDRRVDALVCSELRSVFPDHLVIGEESTVELCRPAADRYAWYLDPIDGTTNFAHSYPHFCVSLALARGNELQLAIVVDPIRPETFFARRGGGATLDDKPIHVSSIADIGSALLGTGFPYDRRERSDFYLGFLRDFMQTSQGIRRTGSAALDLCYVACGRLDGFWEWKLKPWDTAAGALIVHEAGGRMSDFEGQAFDPFGDQTLASNGAIHDAMATTIARRRAG